MFKKIVYSLVFYIAFSISANAQETPSSQSIKNLQNNVMTPPIFNGQKDPDLALGKYVQKNYKIPNNFKGSGTVIVDFVIDKTGQIENIKVMKDVGNGSASEAVKLLKKMPKWTPALDKDGNPVEFNHCLKINLYF